MRVVTKMIKGLEQNDRFWHREVLRCCQSGVPDEPVISRAQNAVHRYGHPSAGANLRSATSLELFASAPRHFFSGSRLRLLNLLLSTLPAIESFSSA